MTHPHSMESPLGETDVAVETQKRVQLQRPSFYKVLIHNDNYTTMDFVIRVLRDVFHKPENEAIEVMWKVHLEGVGVAGIYSREVAETKVAKAEAMAVAHEFPLRFSMQPAEES